MSIAHDAATVSAEWRNTASGSANPFTFTHTPSGTPLGIDLKITAGGPGDIISAVTYGGVAMTRATNGFAEDTLSEAVEAYSYYLLAAVPTGAQTVSITYSDANAQYKRAVCSSMTAVGAIEILDSEKQENNAANPTITLDSGATVAIRYIALYSGALIAGMTPPAEVTNLLDYDVTGGANSVNVARETTPSAGALALTYTVTSDDIAYVGTAYGEVPAGSGPAFIGGGFF